MKNRKNNGGVNMSFKRSFGVLMHPTSVPGPYGIGDLGGNIYKFIDFLHKSGAKLWQIMPLGPTGYGDSPYACFSAIAGNPLLISPDLLLKEGLLEKSDLKSVPDFNGDCVDFGPVIIYKYSLYKKAFANFSKLPAASAIVKDYEKFKNCPDSKVWLDDFALFMALKEKHGGAVWSDWPKPLACREKAAIAKARQELAESFEFHRFLQYLFTKQWLAVKKYANDRNISVIGDIPIFVAYDSSDVWSNPSVFHLDADGKPTVVAGVPPDYFSETGQLWGNPLYRWDELEKRGFDWWILRVKEVLRTVDIIRIDHFRGFEGCWEVPAGSKTAVNGKWVKTRGREMFETLKRSMGELPIIAEDLGVITPPVEKLRDDFNFPGMKILQFAFSADTNNAYLPHNFTKNCVVYTGTHDNETTAGWFKGLPDQIKKNALEYSAGRAAGIHDDFIRLAVASVAVYAIVPLQDILGLDNRARMNTPGKASGNWGYRYRPQDLKASHAKRLNRLCKIYGRL
ncbi:MAG TPA: 4-alpha-glucanotransferase [Candidatus Wallbacteria bacterium]|nr:4-alpha-glucanotransferase [Candidatus Wallbacteria bacterium]